MTVSGTLGKEIGSMHPRVFPKVGPKLALHEVGQDSSKGGAVETGCSDLYDVIY